MSRYLQWIEKTEKWRDTGHDIHAIGRFLEKYDIVYDSDDHVPDPDAVNEFARHAALGDYDLIYCDEDIIRDDERCDPYFKPGYSPDTQRSTGYINGMYAIRKGVSRELWDHERDRVCHIDKVLYHRVREREDVKKGILPDIRPGLDISIIILSKDHPELFRGAYDSLRASLVGENVQIILTDNGSSEANRRKYEEICKVGGIDYAYEPMAFNYSALNNKGAKRAKGEVLIFMNDDIEIPAEEKGILEKLAAKACEEDCGAVGIKLLYPDLTHIQHCGVTILKSGPSHKLSGYEDGSYYHGYSDSDINTLAVTGALLAVRKDRFEKAGGFDEKLAVAYNDVDLCLKLHEEGLYNVCVNSHHLIHYESATRPDDRRDRASYLRLKEEKDLFCKKHEKTLAKGDPYISGNITGTGLDFDINLPMEYEGSGLSEPSVLKKKVRSRNRIHAALDRFDYRLSDAYGNEDFYELSGWIFMEGKNCFDKAVVIRTGETCYLVKATAVPRPDVGEVYKTEKKEKEFGFIARVSMDVLERIREEREFIATPVLVSRRGRIYKGKEECQKKRKI